MMRNFIWVVVFTCGCLPGLFKKEVQEPPKPEKPMAIEASLEPSPDFQADGEEVCALLNLGAWLWENGHLDEANYYLDMALNLAQGLNRWHPSEEYRNLVYFVEHETVALLDRHPQISESQAYDQAALDKLLEGPLFEQEMLNVDPGFSEPMTTETSFPRVQNNWVNRLVQVFTGKRRGVIQRGLKNSEAYVPYIQEVFEELDIPKELAYLPIIESSYMNRAKSRASAIGMWQFMTGTAREFGLKVDWWEDQRMDPYLSTRAAGLYLKQLHEDFGDWYLALAAYNAGPGRVRGAIRRAKTRDFWELSQKRVLPRATIAYVPAFLAVLEISDNPGAYDFYEPEFKTQLPFEWAEVPYCVDLAILASKSDVSLKELNALNPQLLRKITPPNQSYSLRVPLNKGKHIQSVIAEIPEEERVQWTQYKVRNGDTLSSIAKRHGVSLNNLSQANPTINPRRLRIGQMVLLPIGGNRPLPTSMDGTYRIQRGDTLSEIARAHRITVKQLMSWNPGVKATRLKPGSVLKVTP